MRLAILIRKKLPDHRHSPCYQDSRSLLKAFGQPTYEPTYINPPHSSSRNPPQKRRCDGVTLGSSSLAAGGANHTWW